jgi:hypothetical protein
VNRPSLARPLVGREVRCPTCKAAIGAACVVTRGRHAGGRLHGTHPARVRIARAAGTLGGSSLPPFVPYDPSIREEAHERFRLPLRPVGRRGAP